MAIAVIKFDADAKQAKQEISSLEKALSSLNELGIMPTLDVGNLAASAIQIAAHVGQATWELGKLGAETQRIEASFMRLAEASSLSGNVLLQAMRTASRGTIADVDLMMAANRALTLGVVDTVEEAQKLVEAAIIRGRDMGLSATQAVNDLVTGIGRMSPQILDNLGIVGAQAQIESYAASLGKTAQQLTDVEKKQALLNAVLASVKGVEIVDDAAANFEKMDAAISNMKSALGELFSPAIAAIAQSLADAVTEVTDAISTSQLEAAQANLWEIGQAMTDAAQKINAYRTIAESFELLDPAKASEAKRQMSEWQGVIESLGNQYNRFAQITGASLIDVQALTQGVVQFAEAQSKQVAPSIDAVTNKLLAQAQAAREAIAATTASQSASLRSALLGMAGDLGAANALNQYKELNTELQKRTELMQSWGYSAEQIEFANAAWSQKQLERLRDQTKEYGNLERAGTSAARSIDTAFNNLQSRVSSVLSQSLSLDVGLNPADFLPREDAINENARRLAAIMRDGFADQEWLDEFKAEVPNIFDELSSSGDPRSAAAKILQEFQAGLRPELLDRDAVKERVRQMILGEQSMAAMAGEIAQELAAEMGVSLQQVQATMSNLGISGVDGSQMSDQFVEGVDAASIATGVNAKIAQAFKDNESAFRSSGGVVGAWWGEGFLATVGDNIPIQLLEIMTDKLLPLIVARLGQTGGRPDDE